MVDMELVAKMEEVATKAGVNRVDTYKWSVATKVQAAKGWGARGRLVIGMADPTAGGLDSFLGMVNHGPRMVLHLAKCLREEAARADAAEVEIAALRAEIERLKPVTP